MKNTFRTRLAFNNAFGSSLCIAFFISGIFLTVTSCQNNAATSNVTTSNVTTSNVTISNATIINAAASVLTKGDRAMTDNDTKFKEIELGTDTQNTCSPPESKTSGFIGVAINAPSEVRFTPPKTDSIDTLIYLPLCGYYQLDMTQLLKDATIQLFVLDVQTEQVYKGVMLEQDPGTEEPLPFDEPELSADDLEGQLLAAYFNPNVAAYVTIPATRADYKLVVKVGATRSNVVEVKVRPAEK